MKLTKENIDELRAEYKTGAKITDLATKYGVHTTTVNYHLGRDPSSTRPRVERNDNKPKFIVKRKYVKKQKAPVIQAETQSATKPMIAIVGTPTEIVKTLKELFS